MPPVLRLVASLALRLVVAAAFSAFAYYKVGWVAGMLSVPLWGVLLAKPILEGTAMWFDHARKEPYAKWNGNYYAFDDTQIRVYEDDGALWFDARDTLKIVGRALDAQLKVAYPPPGLKCADDGRTWVFSETAVLEVVGHTRHARAGPLGLWLARQVIAPFHKRRAMATRIGND
jgi:hypothetical protein